MWQFTTVLFFGALGACGDDGDDSAGVGESDADTDADTDSDTDSDTDADTDTDTDADIAIAGTWVDDFGATHVITNEEWTTGYPKSKPLVFHITSYENDEGYAVAQNDEANHFAALLWSRFDWVWEGEDLYFCQIAYDAKTEEEAESNTTADDADLAGAGCNGFSWSRLTVK